MAVRQLQPDEFLHPWECSYSLTDSLWDDASAVHALHELRAVCDTVKKKAAEAKKAAAEANCTAQKPGRAKAQAVRGATGKQQQQGSYCTELLLTVRAGRPQGTDLPKQVVMLDSTQLP